MMARQLAINGIFKNMSLLKTKLPGLLPKVECAPAHMACIVIDNASSMNSCIGTVIAVSIPIFIQSLSSSFCASYSITPAIIAPICCSHHGTHISFPNPNQTTLPESICIISTGTSSSPSHHTLHHHTLFLQFKILSSSCFHVQDSFFHQHQSEDMLCLANTNLFLRTMDHHHQDTFYIITFKREGGYQYHYYHLIQNQDTQGQ